MKKPKRICLQLAASAMIMISLAAKATTHDGELGSTSSGHILIRMNTQDLIKISNLSDIILRRSGNGDYTGGSDACIYRNGTGSYSLTAYGSGPGGDFQISDGVTQIGFEVRYSDGAGVFVLSPGVALTGRLNANTRSPNCQSGNNASINIRVPARNIEAAPAGAYVGGLTLIAAPE